MVAVSATASDDVRVVGVQFQLDGVPLAAEDRTAPGSISWNTAHSVSLGSHTLGARARDAVGNQTAGIDQAPGIIGDIGIQRLRASITSERLAPRRASASLRHLASRLHERMYPWSE